MLWDLRNLSIFAMLALVSCVSCAAWDKINANVPDYAGANEGREYAVTAEEGANKGGSLEQIKLCFYRKTNRRPLSVNERQLIHEGNIDGSLKKNVTVWRGIRKKPLVGLSVQLVSKSGIVATENTDAQGTVISREVNEPD